MEAESVDITTLTCDPANVRRHNERNLATIKASLQRFGQQSPLVVDQGGIVRKGNGTLEAARALGWKQISIVRTELTGAEATAYAIADNRSGDPDVGSTWDDDALAQTLAALQIEDEDLARATGFDDKDIAKLISQTCGDVEEDEVPEPPADPITKPGDLWLLGVYYECDKCGKKYTQADNDRMKGVCPCG